jgi:chromosome segregation ATPase
MVGDTAAAVPPEALAQTRGAEASASLTSSSAATDSKQTAPIAATAATEHPQLAKARVALATLKAERDKATACSKKAADAARELKRRNEKLNKVLQGEHERREQLDRGLAATKADAERKASMEQARLSGELDKAANRIGALQTERDQTQQQSAAELQQFRARITDLEGGLQTTTEGKEQAEASYLAAEVTFQNSLQSAQDEAQTAKANLATIENEFVQVRAQMGESETRDRAQAEQLLSETSRIKQTVTQDQVRNEQERERLAHEREQFTLEREQMHADCDAPDTCIRDESAALEKQIANSRTTQETLTRLEIELSDANTATDQAAQQRSVLRSERESSLAELEQALSAEKARW